MAVAAVRSADHDLSACHSAHVAIPGAVWPESFGPGQMAPAGPGEFASNDRIFNDRDLYRMHRKEYS